MMHFRLINADVIDGLATLADSSFQCCVTSPPYWGLRDYGLPPSIWGGDAEHEHEWGEVLPPAKSGPGNKPGEFSTSSLTNPARQNAIHAVANKNGDAGCFCPCGAWRGCLGLEPTPDLYVEHMVTVFREVRRVLRDDGTLWLNIGDSYATNTGPNGGGQGPSGQRAGRTFTSRTKSGLRCPAGFKPKDLVGIPWMLAFALRADGWYLRSEIIWNKPNPMPESVTDRPTKAHETVFLLAKSARYFYNSEAIAEPVALATGPRALRAQISEARATGVPGQPPHSLHEPRSFNGSRFDAGKTAAHQLGRASKKQHKPAGWDTGDGAHGSIHRDGRAAVVEYTDTVSETRNKRSVWTIATAPFPEAHFATFPPDLVDPCILAGSKIGDTVLDPFSGAGTTGVVALSHQRRYVGIELNPEYVAMSRRRLREVAPLLAAELDR